VVYPGAVPGLLYFFYQGVDYGFTGQTVQADALIGKRTPLRTAQIDFWIDHQGTALGAFSFGVVFPQFDRSSASRAAELGYISRCPKPTVLTRTS